MARRPFASDLFFSLPAKDAGSIETCIQGATKIMFPFWEPEGWIHSGSRLPASQIPACKIMSAIPLPDPARGDFKERSPWISL
jgi:hypothetical protein